MRLVALLAELLAWSVPEIQAQGHPNVIVQAFPPAKIIFTGIGVLLAVRIFAVPFPGSLITARLHRQQKM